MFRTFILPVILMGCIGGPMLYSHHRHQIANQSISSTNQTTPTPWQNASFPTTPPPLGGIDGTSRTNPTWPNQPIFTSDTAKAGYVNSLLATPVRTLQSQRLAEGPLSQPSGQVFGSTSSPGQTIQAPMNTIAFSADAWNRPGMTPDFAKAQTLIFPGDANGPDLTAAPMSFVPTMDLSSLFRFEISKDWITSRWDRVSTTPASDGLSGMRVALVTGTNSWDLHGALTYFFDANHELQRITYRGWTGDASRLLQILQQQHGLRPIPTHWAGLFLSKRSGLMMKHPAVIDKSNPVQQLGLVLEINNPRGKTQLSSDFQSLLPAAMATR